MGGSRSALAKSLRDTEGLCHAHTAPLKWEFSQEITQVLAAHAYIFLGFSRPSLSWRDIPSAPGRRNPLLQPLKQAVSESHENFTTGRLGTRCLFHLPDLCGPSGHVTTFPEYLLLPPTLQSLATACLAEYQAFT